MNMCENSYFSYLAHVHGLPQAIHQRFRLQLPSFPWGAEIFSDIHGRVSNVHRNLVPPAKNELHSGNVQDQRLAGLGCILRLAMDVFGKQSKAAG